MTGGGYDLTKVSSRGEMVWNRSFVSPDPGDSWFYAEDVVACDSGGYAVCGRFSHHVASYSEMWLMRTNSSGEEQWHKYYDDGLWGRANCIIECTDGGFFLVGDEGSIRTDSDGNLLWNRTIDIDDTGVSCVQCSDDGFLIVTEYARAIRLDSSGDVLWTKEYAEESPLDETTIGSIIQCSSGGYAISGKNKKKTSIGSNPREEVVLLIRTDEHGEVQWNRTFSGGSDLGPKCDEPAQLLERSSGGFALACTAGYRPYFVVWLIVTPDSPRWQEEQRIGLFLLISASGIIGVGVVVLRVGWRYIFTKGDKDEITIPTKYRLYSWLRTRRPIKQEEVDESLE
jgi:hypothetical protein